MEIVKYPDGSSYAKINPQSNSNFVFKINSYEDIWHLHQIVDAFNNLGIVPEITIPNLIDAQGDRRFASNESSGLKLVCNFLNQMNANFKIFHPHNPEVVEALIDGVGIIGNSLFIRKILNPTTTSKSKIDTKNLILMSADAGGFKPLMKLCDKLQWQGEVASASKSREYKNGETRITRLIAHSDFRGKDILIIDDICVYGGTFKGLAKLLRKRNCGKLYLAVSHMTVQNLGEDPVTNYFDKVFTTNSKYEEYNWNTCTGNVNPKNLEIIKIF